VGEQAAVADGQQMIDKGYGKSSANLSVAPMLSCKCHTAEEKE
jgi:hypothetical protein